MWPFKKKGNGKDQHVEEEAVEEAVVEADGAVPSLDCAEGTDEENTGEFFTEDLPNRTKNDPPLMRTIHRQDKMSKEFYDAIDEDIESLRKIRVKLAKLKIKKT